MFKKALLAGAALAISAAVFSTSATAAGLTLVSKNTTAPITVYCNNKKGLYDIPKNGSLGPLPWGIISMMFGANDMDCKFVLDDSAQETLGTAHMTVTSSTGMISGNSVKVLDSHYTVTATPSWDTANADMTVTLTKTS